MAHIQPHAGTPEQLDHARGGIGGRDVICRVLHGLDRVRPVAIEVERIGSGLQGVVQGNRDFQADDLEQARHASHDGVVRPGFIVREVRWTVGDGAVAAKGCVRRNRIALGQADARTRLPHGDARVVGAVEVGWASIGHRRAVNIARRRVDPHGLGVETGIGPELLHAIAHPIGEKDAVIAARDVVQRDRIGVQGEGPDQQFNGRVVRVAERLKDLDIVVVQNPAAARQLEDAQALGGDVVVADPHGCRAPTIGGRNRPRWACGVSSGGGEHVVMEPEIIHRGGDGDVRGQVTHEQLRAEFAVRAIGLDENPRARGPVTKVGDSHVVVMVRQGPDDRGRVMDGVSVGDEIALDIEVADFHPLLAREFEQRPGPTELDLGLTDAPRLLAVQKRYDRAVIGDVVERRRGSPDDFRRWREQSRRRIGAFDRRAVVNDPVRHYSGEVLNRDGLAHLVLGGTDNSPNTGLQEVDVLRQVRANGRAEGQGLRRVHRDVRAVYLQRADGVSGDRGGHAVPDKDFHIVRGDLKQLLAIGPDTPDDALAALVQGNRVLILDRLARILPCRFRIRRTGLERIDTPSGQRVAVAVKELQNSRRKQCSRHGDPLKWTS